MQPKITFSDGSYIEETKSGLIYVGLIANECSHLIRKTNCTLSDFIEVFNTLVNKAIVNKK